MDLFRLPYPLPFVNVIFNAFCGVTFHHESAAQLISQRDSFVLHGSKRAQIQKMELIRVLAIYTQLGAYIQCIIKQISTSTSGFTSNL